ncbi:hypothetical protein BACCIP111899_01370 [Bacillus rhizoplanae]|uniref:Uncharacterized protein n=1 Tax=Bacillus rhizoplanae TaxID=2880966 RepID=A0ABM8Y8W3_9BACI|nr:hypothetical protein BACCIP111899_01370 [Bacillus rhizoplanae]
MLAGLEAMRRIKKGQTFQNEKSVPKKHTLIFLIHIFFTPEPLHNQSIMKKIRFVLKQFRLIMKTHITQLPYPTDALVLQKQFPVRDALLHKSHVVQDEVHHSYQ